MFLNGTFHCGPHARGEVRRLLDKEDKGLGLGLFISKNLLSKSYGDIEFLNYKPNGACVRIFLNKRELNIK